VNGKKTPEPQEDWMMMLKNMQEEQVRMRDAMKRERTEQDNRMKDVLSRLERAEQELDKSVKRKDEVERECELLKGQQAEQRQLLLHVSFGVNAMQRGANRSSSSNLLWIAYPNQPMVFCLQRDYCKMQCATGRHPCNKNSLPCVNWRRLFHTCSHWLDCHLKKKTEQQTLIFFFVLTFSVFIILSLFSFHSSTLYL
jgi:hypothetical protein